MSFDVIRVHPNTTEWLSARKNGIGASDAAAILGASPWSTPYKVWRNKISDELDARPETNHQYWGHKHEESVAEWMREKEGFTVVDPIGIYWSVEHPRLFATLDRLIVTDDTDDQGDPLLVPLEIKTSDAWKKEEWASGPPVAYRIQVQVQMLVTGAPYAYLAVLHGGNDAQWFRLEADRGLQTYLAGRVAAFWAEHVETGTPPAPTAKDDLADVFPGDPAAEPAEADDYTAAEWIELGQWQAAAKTAQENIDELTFSLKSKMGDRTALVYEGDTLITWNRRRGQTRLDGKRLKAEHPELWEQYAVKGADTRVFYRKTVEQLEKQKDRILKAKQREAGILLD